MKTWMIWLVVGGMSVWGAGCEDDKGGNHEERIVEETTEGDYTESSSYSARDVSGTWTGKAGTGQGKTVLKLRQDGSSLSGSWVWGAGDTRNCGGYRNGLSVVLWDNEPKGDLWRMTVSEDGTSLCGTAEKYGGGAYAVTFNR